MKKLIGIMAAGLLVLGFAGQSMAAFTTGDLIRVIYTPGATYEYATDLGSLSSLESSATTTPTLISNSGFSSYAGSLSNALVTYFVVGSSKGPGNTYIDVAATFSPTQQQGAGTLANDEGLFTAANTGVLTNYAGLTPIVSSPATVEQQLTNPYSYVSVLDTGGANAGTYSVLFQQDLEASLGSLGSGNVVMNLYNFNNGTSEGIGYQGVPIQVSGANFEIITAANGTEIAEQASSVPVPPSLLLLAPGLFGLIGLRRRVGK